jgi:hypothetical protein
MRIRICNPPFTALSGASILPQSRSEFERLSHRSVRDDLHFCFLPTKFFLSFCILESKVYFYYFRYNVHFYVRPIVHQKIAVNNGGLN